MKTLVLVSGPSGSGKSSVAQLVADQLQHGCHLFQQDSYFTTPFLPYGQRQDASYEDGSGVDWGKMKKDMESSITESQTGCRTIILVEGHMLGLGISHFLAAFDGTASIRIVTLQCSRVISKKRRLYRRERSEEETQELSRYIDQCVWPSYLKFGLPALESLRLMASANPERDIQVLKLSADKDNSLATNVEKVLEFLDKTTEVVDEWPSLSGNNNLQGFADHYDMTLRYDRTDEGTFPLQCVSSLTPLDMIYLSQGSHDATGSSVWMGAYILLEALAANVACKQQQNDDIATLRDLFRSKRVLELGCGTGVAGIGLLLQADPSHIVFTDNDTAVLNLCRRNCEQNGITPLHSSFECLNWGTEIEVYQRRFDIVLATDVLYDLACLEPLLLTTLQSLGESGMFVLAHVPRSCLPETKEDTSNSSNGGYHKALEDHIIECAEGCGLKGMAVVRPEQIREALGDEVEPLNDMSLQEMEEAGAAILVFQKQHVPDYTI